MLLYQMQKTTPGGYWIEEVQQIYLFVNSIAICQKSLKPSYWEVMDPSVLPEYAHLAGSITSLLYFTLESKDLFCWYKWKKVISMNYSCSTSSWKSWRWVRDIYDEGIYINFSLNQLTESSRSNIYNLKISFHGTSRKWTWRPF